MRRVVSYVFLLLVRVTAFHQTLEYAKTLRAIAVAERTLLVRKALQIWVDTRASSPPKSFISQADFVLGDDNQGSTAIVKDGVIMESNRVIGKLIDASTSEGQDEGLAAIGSVEWVLAESSSSDWKMIPAENLIAAARNGGTKIAFYVDRLEDVVGFSRALELGVDALCIKADVSSDIFNAVLAAKQDRSDSQYELPQHEPEIVDGYCYRMAEKNSVLADRVCVDFVQMLVPEEGCWIGSSAMLTSLVLSEAASSSLVPSRPFRVNAGPVHSYVVMGDGQRTKYLCELEAGDEVAIYNSKTGDSRSVAVGRLKLEIRPCFVVGLETNDGISAQAILQQAETVRLGGKDGSFVRVTELFGQEMKTPVLLRLAALGTHIGEAYTGKVVER